MRLSNHRVLCGTFLFPKTHKFGKVIVRQNSLSNFNLPWRSILLLQDFDVNLPDFHRKTGHFHVVKWVYFAFWWTTYFFPPLD